MGCFRVGKFWDGLGRLDAVDVLELGHSGGWDVFGLGAFCSGDVRWLGRFIGGTLCSGKFCSWDVFWLGLFVFGRFVGVPFIKIKFISSDNNRLIQNTASQLTNSITSMDNILISRL